LSKGVAAACLGLAFGMIGAAPATGEYRMEFGSLYLMDGEPLVIVEAMKMENVLRAERRGTVKKINASVGGSLAVDDVIMEFE
ncbi:MAG: biotin/lipoyl-containing protein, partial [Roseinatronobacter sp.]